MICQRNQTVFKPKKSYYEKVNIVYNDAALRFYHGSGRRKILWN